MVKKFLVVFITVILAGCGSETTDTELLAKIAELEETNAELEATNAELEAANAKLEATNSEFEATNAEPSTIYYYNDEASAKYHERLADSNRQLLIYGDADMFIYGYNVFPTKDGIFDMIGYNLILNDNSIEGKTAELDDHLYDLPCHCSYVAYDEVSKRLLLQDSACALLVFDLNSESFELITTESFFYQLNTDTPSLLTYADSERIEYSCNWTVSSSSCATGRTDIVPYKYTGTVALLDSGYTWDVESRNIYDSSGNIVLSNIVDYDYNFKVMDHIYLLDNKGTLYYYQKSNPSFQIVGENIISIIPNGIECWPTFYVDEKSIYDENFWSVTDWSGGKTVIY